jgi:hypothetical protein
MSNASSACFLSPAVLGMIEIHLSLAPPSFVLPLYLPWAPRAAVAAVVAGVAVLAVAKAEVAAGPQEDFWDDHVEFSSMHTLTDLYHISCYPLSLYHGDGILI